VALPREVLMRQGAVHVHKTLTRPAFFPPLADVQHQQCERKRDDRPRERVKSGLGSAEQALLGDRLLAAVRE